jgi:CheY-like chemotaxis protein
VPLRQRGNPWKKGLDRLSPVPEVKVVNPAPVILAAEDNDDDFVLLRCAFESAGFPHKLIGVINGVEAVDYLYADEPFTNRSAFPFPDLMLLDLQMPVMDGIAVLAAVKERREFRSLPIIVLSSTDDRGIIREAFQLGAKDVLTKPLTMSERIDMVRQLHSRWLAAETKPVPRQNGQSVVS